MFKLKKEEVKGGEVVAFLDKGIEFRGVLTFEGTIRVDGKVEGEIVSKGTLMLGNDAFINGTINVGTLISHGRIKGDVVAKNKISLLSGSILNGNIKTPVLIVEEGASFEGNSVMLKEEKAVVPEKAIASPFRSQSEAMPKEEEKVIPIDTHKEKPLWDEEGRIKESTL